MIWLLLQVGLIASQAGGSPHFVTVNFQHVMVSDVYADGSTLTRPAFGYHVWRAPVVNGVSGTFVLLNPDVLVLGTLDGDGNPADCDFLDEQAVEGMTYVYSVSAVDFGGESALSPSFTAAPIPINPNAPLNLQAK